jgi:hypothetical protein
VVAVAVVLLPSHRLCFRRKGSIIVLPSSVGLEGGASAALSVATRSAHVVSPSSAFVVVILVIGSVFVGFFLQTSVLALRTLVLLVSGGPLRMLSLGVPRRPGVGLRLWATHRCVQMCRQDSLPGIARSLASTPVWTLSFCLGLP